MNASDLAELMGMARGARWNAVGKLAQLESLYCTETGSEPVPRKQEERGMWDIDAPAAEKFAEWYVSRELATGQTDRWIAICTKAFAAFRVEMTSLGAPGVLDFVGITDPFFDRIEPRENHESQTLGCVPDTSSTD